MRFITAIWVCFLLALLPLRAQQGYHLSEGETRETIRFEFLNNLIIVPVEVNGVELSFILDTGVSTPILFNMMEEGDLELRNKETIMVKGLGEGKPITAIRSTGNTFRLKDLVNSSQELYMLTDSNINFSPQMGIPIHGIIGYDLLKNFIVEVNYHSKKLRFHQPEQYRYKRCKNCETYRLDIVGNKPFVKAEVGFGEEGTLPVYLLVDSGSSDAVWLFEDRERGIEVPEQHFEDYMGQGLSGDVFGKRSRLNRFQIGNFELEDAKVAFPDSSCVQNITFTGSRNGSMGSEILKRFNLVIDYPYRRITLSKNGHFKDPFHYNMSGIELEHNGMRVVTESSGGSRFNRRESNSDSGFTVSMSQVLSIELKPALQIAALREKSPAKEVGLKEGDVIISVNGRDTHEFNIQEVKEMLNKKPGKTLRLEIDRNGQRLTFAFKLREVL